MFGSLVKIKKALIEELNTLESEGCLFDEQRYQIFKQLKQKYGLIKNTDEKAKLLKKIGIPVYIQSPSVSINKILQISGIYEIMPKI